MDERDKGEDDDDDDDGDGDDSDTYIYIVYSIYIYIYIYSIVMMFKLYHFFHWLPGMIQEDWWEAWMVGPSVDADGSRLRGFLDFQGQWRFGCIWCTIYIYIGP